MTEDELKAIEMRARAEGTATWDEKFIIHARRDIPALTAALREAWEENKALRRQYRKDHVQDWRMECG